eukprot:SAG31_NODE_12031_length_975_cov_1.547945_1_plen_194_part_10
MKSTVEAPGHYNPCHADLMSAPKPRKPAAGVLVAPVTVLGPRRSWPCRHRLALLATVVAVVLIGTVVIAAALQASAEQMCGSLVCAVVPAANPGGEPQPGLVVLLHGSGGDEFDLLDVGSAVSPPDHMIVSLRAPLPFGFDQGGYRWFEGSSGDPAPIALDASLGTSCDRIFESIEAAIAEYGVDRDRVLLLGF